MAKSETLAETGVGAVVLAAAAGFLIYALGHAAKGADAGGYEVIGKFGDVGAMATGADGARALDLALAVEMAAGL
jgi:ABC-type transporter Mla subunit MlaD